MGEASVVIGIATYRRPEMLQRLLHSVDASIGECTESIRIVVVDNDPLKSAEHACASLQLRTRVGYVSEPKPGISAARNAIVRAAAGCDYLVFVDDDEWVDPHWLAELMSVREQSSAQMVAGPVHSLLPDSAPALLLSSGLFDRPKRADGTVLAEAGTGNLLCDYRLFSSRHSSSWFNDQFGTSGGEDAELTRRFVREGALLVWAAEAHAWESVPPDRANLSWLRARYRRIGAADLRISGFSVHKRVAGFAAGLLRVLSATPHYYSIRLFAGRIDAQAFRRLHRGFGYMAAAVGRIPAEYGREKE